MKVLAVNSARSIWLVPALFLNPRGRYIVPVLSALTERYNFVKAPQAADLAATQLNLKFEGGSFIGSDGKPIFVNVSIHDDGIVAETRTSTDESDAFLAEALSWFSAQFGLPHHADLGVDRIYASELMVQLNLPTNIFNEKFSQFVSRLQRGVSNNPEIPMELVSLHFGPNPATTKKIAPFRIERVVGVPFEKKQYYSVAPIPTSEHIDFLRLLEQSAAS